MAKLKVSIHSVQNASSNADVVAIDDSAQHVEEHTAASEAQPGSSGLRLKRVAHG